MDQNDRDDWRRADEILDALLDVPAEQRGTHLDAMNLSPGLRARVDSLLAALDSTDGVLDQPGPLPLPPMPDALDGRRLGRWLLEEEVGRGGMAVVYRAQSTEGPTGQVAAVKVLTMGALAATGATRFLHEQQALLRLRHAYIANLYDAGIAEDGTAWLAMALVDGEPIDAWCDRHGLDVRARIRLMLQVGEALAYAHRNLVIHRDIKPSNVLVDEDGHVRLLDFGIARCVDAIDTDSQRTATMLRILTPGYAAPEQFAGAAPSTAMDVFGLGALLYRLLTGIAPRSGMDDTQPITAPSRCARANTVPDQIAQRQWSRQLRGDLDAVLLKALAHQPEARYASIDAFTGDLKRWLDGKPVQAQPPSRRYRLGKFVARNKLAFAAAAALLLAVFGGTAATAWQMHKAQMEAKRANAALARAEAAKAESEAHRKYLSRAFAVLVPTTAEDSELDRKEVMDKLVEHAHGEFADKPGLLASVELDLGIIAHSLGNNERGRTLLASALKRRLALYGPDSLLTAEAQAQFAKSMRTGKDADYKGAERLFAQAAATLRKHGAPAKTMVPALLVWSVTLQQLGRQDEALERLEEAATFCDGALKQDTICEKVWLYKGLQAERSGHSREAIAALEPLYALRRKAYGDDHATTLIAGSQLGRAYLRAGEAERGTALLEDVLARQQKIYPEDHGEILFTTYDLARGYALLGRMAEARKLYQWYVDRTREQHGEQHYGVANGYLALATVAQNEADYAQAAKYAERAHGIFAALNGGDSPGAVVANSYRADALRDLGRLAQAERLHRKVLAQTVAAFGSDHPRVASRTAALARTLVLQDKAEESLSYYDKALALYRAAKADNPTEIGFAAVRAARSRALLALGRGAEAVSEVRAALAEMERMGEREQRYYWESVALLTDNACRIDAPDCAELRRTSRELAARPQMPGRSRQMLARAGAGEPLD